MSVPPFSDKIVQFWLQKEVFSGKLNVLCCYRTLAVETKEFLESLAKTKFNVILRECPDDYDYDDAVAYLWLSKEPFIILEQDIVPSSELFHSMATCRKPICAGAYILYPKTTGLPEPVWAHRNVTAESHMLLSAGWIQEKDESSDIYGFGLVKFKPEVTGKIPIAEWYRRGNWRDLDSRIGFLTHRAGFKAHIHWGECKHLHEE